MNTSDFLTAVKRAITVPNYQARFSPDDLLALGNEEQRTLIFPLMKTLRAGFFDTSTTQALAVGDTVINIPYRAIGRTLVQVLFQETNGRLYPIYHINTADSYAFQQPEQNGSPCGFYTENDRLILVPPVSTAGTAIIKYPQRSGILVDLARGALVTAVGTTTITVKKLPSNIALNTNVDLISAVPGYVTTYSDISVTNVNGLILTLSGFSVSMPITGVSVGDYVTTATETVLVQMPDEVQDVLTQATAVRVLHALGTPEMITESQKLLERKMAAARDLLDPRVESSREKCVNRNGLARRGRRRGYPSVQV